MGENRSGCFKLSCLGCLSVVALIVGLVILLGAFELTMDSGDPRHEERQAEHPLPEAPSVPAYAGVEDVGGEDIGVEGVTTDQITVPQGLSLEDAQGQPPVGKVVLDLSLGEFTVRPGAAGEPLRVEASYDANRFELTEEMQQEDDGSWTYTVSFGARHGILGLFRSRRSGSSSEVEVIIPRGHPLDLVGKLGIGEASVNLDGLWLRRVDLELDAGEHFFEIGDPLPHPMESFRLEKSVGSLEVHGLGHGSPEKVSVSQNIGELFLDLEGAWRRDAAVRASLDIGETQVRLAKTAHTRIDRARINIGNRSIDDEPPENLPEDAPTVHLEISGSIGEISVDP